MPWLALACLLSEVLWRGDLETGNLDQWTFKLNPGGLEVVSEPKREGFHALHVHIRPTDLGKNGLNRVEVNHKMTIAEGDDRYYAWSIYLPKALSSEPRQLGTFETSTSFKQIMAVQARGTTFEFVTRQPQTVVRYSREGKLTPGLWHDFVIHVRWSRDPAKGLVDVWLDGDRAVSGLSMATLIDENTPFLQMGILRQPTSSEEDLFLDRAIEATSLVDVLPPLEMNAPGELKREIEFSRPGGERLTLDAFVPAGKGPFPTAIVVHGGGFTRGDKHSYVPPLLRVLADAGFAWFTIDYRLAPRHKFPAAVDDVEAALKWVRTHARQYKVDLKRLVLTGESAGGYLVSLVGTRYKRGGALAAVVPFYGRHNFDLSKSAALTDFFGIDPTAPDAGKKVRAVSPLHLIKRDMPPYLLIHSTDDPQVPYAESVKMCEAMTAAGARCELFTTQGLGHGLGKWKDVPAEHQRLIGWLRETLR